MKLIFQGWGGGGKTHAHALTPIQFKNGGYSVTSEGPVDWLSSTEIVARVGNLRLTGDYLVKIEMESKELINWLAVFAKEQPEQALAIINQAQTEALIALTKLNAE